MAEQYLETTDETQVPRRAYETGDLAFVISSGNEAAMIDLSEYTAASQAAIDALGDRTPRGDWATATLYAIKDLVKESGTWYMAVEEHTSGVFATDLAAGKLVIYQGLARPISLIGAGDSIMAGTTSPNTTTPISVLSGLLPDVVSTAETAVPGSRLYVGTSNMASRYTEFVYPHRPSVTGVDSAFLLIIIGANDFSPTADNEVADWITQFDSYCNTARDDGFTVIASTVMERSSSNMWASNNIRRLQFNDHIRSTTSIDGYVDLARLLPDVTDTALFIDGTHPTDAGTAIMCRAFREHVLAPGVPAGGVDLSESRALELAPADISTLEYAALESRISTYNVNTSAIARFNQPPAFGINDFTITAWSDCKARGVRRIMSALSESQGSFGLSIDDDGVTPYFVVGSQILSERYGVPDRWSHFAVTRASGYLTFYVNGRPVGDPHYVPGDVASLTRLMNSSEFRVSRVRQHNVAMTQDEITSDMNSLSAYNGEASCIYAMDDAGKWCAGSFLPDLSSSAAHVNYSSADDYTPSIPGRRGVAMFPTSGNESVWAIPPDVWITDWFVDITTAGVGIGKIGIASDSDYWFVGGNGVGRHRLDLASHSMTTEQEIFMGDATGYEMTHNISFTV